MKKGQPGCRGCGCQGWKGTKPSQLQVTIPADCVRAGVYLLNLSASSYYGDCPTHSPALAHTCDTWGYPRGDWGDEGVGIGVTIGNDANGKTVIHGSICGDNDSGSFSRNAGTVWTMYPVNFNDWQFLDGLILPINVSDGADDSFCSSPGDLLIEIP